MDRSPWNGAMDVLNGIQSKSIVTHHVRQTQHEEFYESVSNAKQRAALMPFAYGDFVDWKDVIATMPRDAHNNPLLHEQFLSRGCPVDVTRVYIRNQIPSADAWRAEWTSVNFLPVYTGDNTNRITALDMIFLNGTVKQLTMILEDYAVHVWPYICDSLGFRHRHPLRVITAGAVPRSEQTKMALVLWDFIVRMSADVSTHANYLSYEWLVWKRDPDALELAVPKFVTAMEIELVD